MKKFLKLIVILTAVWSLGCSGKSAKVDNDEALANHKIRTVTIVNQTDEVINEFHVLVGDGTELNDLSLKNPDDDSFSIRIDEKYEEYEKFTFVLVDRYGLQYEKQAKVKPDGNTEITIDKNDEVSQKGDFWKKVNRFFN